MRISVVVVAAAVAGLVASCVPPRSSSCDCSTTPTPPARPAGHADVKFLGDGPDGPRFRVFADDAPASHLLVRVGEALGVEARLDHALESISITLFIPDVSLDRLMTLLYDSGVRLSRPEWTNEHRLVFQVPPTPDAKR